MMLRVFALIFAIGHCHASSDIILNDYSLAAVTVKL